jgi:hypothetical protein
MPQLFTNNAISLLENSISISDLTIQVTTGSGHLYPQPINADDFFLITLEETPSGGNEIIKIIGRTGDVLTVDPVGRGWEGTTPRAWPSHAVVDHRITAGTLSKFLTSQNVTVPTAGPQVVYSTTTGNVDIFTTSAINRTCKWLVSIIDNINNKVAMMEILAISRGATRPPAFTRYAQVGDTFSIAVNVTQVGNDLKLNITNNTPDDLLIEIIRMHNF